MGANALYSSCLLISMVSDIDDGRRRVESGVLHASHAARWLLVDGTHSSRHFRQHFFAKHSSRHFPILPAIFSPRILPAENVIADNKIFHGFLCGYEGGRLCRPRASRQAKWQCAMRIGLGGTTTATYCFCRFRICTRYTHLHFDFGSSILKETKTPSLI